MYPSVLPRQPLNFTNGNAFQLELRRRVEEYFRTTGHRPRDCWQMYVKTAVLLAGFTILYALLVFVPRLGGRASCWPYCSASRRPGLASIFSTTAAITPIRITRGSTS
jgi:hypothetical protein